MKSARQPQRHTQSGLTLVELVLVMIVMSVITVPIANYLKGSVQAYLATKDNINGTNEIRYAMNRLSQELRNIDYSAGQYQIATTITPPGPFTQVQFTNTSTATITINYTGSAVEITDTSIDAVNPYTLADQVTAFSLYFYKLDETEANDGTDLAFVEFEMTLQEGNVSYTSRSRVAMRDAQ